MQPQEGSLGIWATHWDNDTAAAGKTSICPSSGTSSPHPIVWHRQDQKGIPERCPNLLLAERNTLFSDTPEGFGGGFFWQNLNSWISFKNKAKSQRAKDCLIRCR